VNANETKTESEVDRPWWEVDGWNDISDEERETIREDAKAVDAAILEADDEKLASGFENAKPEVERLGREAREALVRYRVVQRYYAKHRADMADRQRTKSQQGRDIGALPPVVDPARREACREDLGKFLKTYFPGTFRHDWSAVHLRLIELIQIVVLVGALLAMGIPRGWGKTSLCVRAVIWAIAYRHHVFVMLIGASNDAAKAMIEDIRTELESNAILLEDFPELCIPIKELEGVNQRGKAQLCCGKRTKVFASHHELRLGNVGGQSGGIIRAGGILSSKIRGARHVVDGAVIRPTLGLVDDPQTEASAASKRSCYRRERVIQAALPGLPGAGEAWSCLMTMTVIEPGDVADRVLDRDKHPDWHGVRHAALDSLPTPDAMDLWFEWNQIREACLRKDEDLQPAHRFYKKNMKAMKDGATIVWKDGYDPDRFVDPLEQAMDWFFRDRQGFWSELMNNPAGFEPEGRPKLDRDTVAVRCHHLKAEAAPLESEFVTAFIDVQQQCLFYEVRAHAMDSTSWILQYGTWPGQPRAYYTLSDIKMTLETMYPKMPNLQTRLIAAVKDLAKLLFEKEWKREDGHTLHLNVAGIDANWETETIKKAVRISGYMNRLIPTHGRSFRPPKTAINELSKKKTDRVGLFWRLRSPREKEAIRHLIYDVDHWKSHHRDRLLIPQEAPGSCSLFAGRDHTMYADHQLSEYSNFIHDISSQRTVEVWEHRPERPDNHFWDCSVGNSMLGGMLGCVLPDAAAVGQQQIRRRKPKKKRRTTGPIW
jgi:hypothetical protein